MLVCLVIYIDFTFLSICLCKFLIGLRFYLCLNLDYSF